MNVRKIAAVRDQAPATRLPLVTYRDHHSGDSDTRQSDLMDVTENMFRVAAAEQDEGLTDVGFKDSDVRITPRLRHDQLRHYYA
ncbi:hypothetical protein J6590_052128 [Homalodisca vitripennis]|nr:hypothetical protein J6590_052128 [Homalodisca vitripennis]